jgi:hypothetical protein
MKYVHIASVPVHSVIYNCRLQNTSNTKSDKVWIYLDLPVGKVYAVVGGFVQQATRYQQINKIK